MTEKLCVVPVFPIQALSACIEEGLTSIVGWWLMGPLVSSLEGNGFKTL